MKSHITVLIKRNAKNLEEQLRKNIEAYRLDEDSIESIESHHWDYWYFPDDENLNDSELKSNFPLESDDVLSNSCYIKNIPEEFSTSGVICFDNTWVDLQDFGWRLLNEPSSENDKANRNWKEKFAWLLSENKDAICVQIITHC
jgi:hypothetical protein